MRAWYIGIPVSSDFASKLLKFRLFGEVFSDLQRSDHGFFQLFFLEQVINFKNWKVSSQAYPGRLPYVIVKANVSKVCSQEAPKHF